MSGGRGRGDMRETRGADGVLEGEGGLAKRHEHFYVSGFGSFCCFTSHSGLSWFAELYFLACRCVFFYTFSVLFSSVLFRSLLFFSVLFYRYENTSHGVPRDERS